MSKPGYVIVNFLVSFLLISSSVFAGMKQDLLQKIDEIFPEIYRAEAKRDLEQITFLDPALFRKKIQGQWHPIAQGFNGGIWRKSGSEKEGGLLLKISNFIQPGHPLFEFWMKKEAFYNPRSMDKEVLGTLIWNIFVRNKKSLSLLPLPTIVAEDGSAYFRTFVEGENALKLEKNADFWKAAVEIQKRGEEILIETGFGVDLASLANILRISNDPQILLPLDLELMAPSDETKAYYKEKGTPLPEISFDPSWTWVVWPYIPEHVVMSKNWGLSLAQAVDWVRARHSLDYRGALAFLAKLPRFIFAISNVADYAVLEEAKKACETSATQ